jgi:hypothetical protein
MKPVAQPMARILQQLGAKQRATETSQPADRLRDSSSSAQGGSALRTDRYGNKLPLWPTGRHSVTT